MLRYVYTSAEEHWNVKAKDYLRRRLVERLRGLPREDRPDNFEAIEGGGEAHLPVGYKRPEPWRYLDDEIPALYAEWKRTAPPEWAPAGVVGDGD